MSNKSRRLLHMDFFFKVTMEEGILDVQLMKPMPYSNHRQKETNRSQLGSRGENVAIIQTKDLSVALGY